MFSINQKVKYKLKPKHIGTIKGIELVNGSHGERVNYFLKYSDERTLVHAEGRLLEVAR